MLRFAARIVAAAIAALLLSTAHARAQAGSAKEAAKDLYAWYVGTNCGNWLSKWPETQEFVDLGLYKGLSTLIKERNKFDYNVFDVDIFTNIQWCGSSYRVGTPVTLDNGDVSVPVAVGIEGMPGSAGATRYVHVRVIVRQDDDGWRVYDLAGQDGNGSLRAWIRETLAKLPD